MQAANFGFGGIRKGISKTDHDGLSQRHHPLLRIIAFPIILRDEHSKPPSLLRSAILTGIYLSNALVIVFLLEVEARKSQK